MPKVIIGILAYNGEKYFDRCLGSLFKQDFADLEIIVFDNASPNNDYKILQERYGDKVKIIRSEKNLGFGRGHNKIIQETESEYYLCLNQDMFFDKNFVTELVRAIEKDPKYGMATGKLYRWDFENDKKTDKIDTVGMKAYANHHFADRGQDEKDLGQYDKEKEIFGSSGSAVLFRRIALDDVGLFDDLMFMYKEDIDLNYRFQWAGWKCVYTPKALAWHDRTIEKTKERIKRNPKIREWSYLNHLIMVEKNFSPHYSLMTKIKTRFYLFLRKIWAHIIERDTINAEKEFKNLMPEIIKRKEAMQKRVSAKEIEKYFN